MTMGAVSKLKSEENVSAKRIRKSVCGVLGWDETAYTNFRLNMPPLQCHDLLINYGAICAEMAQQYKQWSSNLMIEWDGDEDKSNYVAPYPQKQAPNGVQTIAQYRFNYLDYLYNYLSRREQDVYGEILSPGYLVDGCMPDIKAVYTIYKLQDILKYQQLRVQDLIQANIIARSPNVLDVKTPDLIRRLVDEELGSLLQTPTENKDSLFARLLLNTTANRSLLELAEHERLDQQAKTGMIALVRHLRQQYLNGKLPRMHNLQHVRETVATVMDSPPPGYNWRRFKGNALNNVLQRAGAIADTDTKIALSPRAEAYRWDYVLLTTLAVAWSYCTKEQHDSRVVRDNHRICDVIDGRSREDVKIHSPNLRFYHERQFHLLWFSEQMHTLDEDRLEQQYAKSHRLRQIFQHYICKLKLLSLDQWTQLDIALSSLLRGTSWDTLEPLVTVDHRQSSA